MLIISLYAPNGTYNCLDLYMEIQNMNQLTDWGLGNDVGSSTSQSLVLDDFRIYNWPLSPAEVYGLDVTERGSYAGKPHPHCNTCGNNGEENEAANTNMHNIAATIAASDNVHIYPNPAKDQVTISLLMQEDDNLQVNITDMAGRTFISKIFAVNTGNQSIMLNNLGLANGTYIVNINGKKLNGNYKLVIDNK
jgi:hypothetical protein